MNPGEISERLIQAAEIAIFSGGQVGPSHARSLNLGYAHSWADVNGWGKERLEEEARLLWERILRRPTPQQVSEGEEALGWLALVAKEQDRAALSAWVWAMANPHLHFKDWCFEKAGIHPETGRRRKDRALACIARKLLGRASQNNENAGFGVLPEEPEIEDTLDSLAAPVQETSSIVSWAADDAFSSFFSDRPADFSWARKRNERRRRRGLKQKEREVI